MFYNEKKFNRVFLVEMQLITTWIKFWGKVALYRWRGLCAQRNNYNPSDARKSIIQGT